MTSWWAVVRKPDGSTHAHELGAEPYDAELGKVRSTHGVPKDGAHEAGWDVSVFPGEPHPELIWSPEDIAAKRDEVEAREGIPQQRANLLALEVAAKQAADSGVPAEVLAPMHEAVARMRRGMREVPLAQVHAALMDTPASRAAVHRKKLKP